MTHWLQLAVTLLSSETSDLIQLCQIAGGDLRTFYRGVDLKKLGVPEGDRERLRRAVANEVIKSVRLKVRQEERIALLLREFLDDPEAGSIAISTYPEDRAKFARTAVRLIQSELRGRDLNNVDERTVAYVIPRLFDEVFPYNRGIFLVFLAKHLAKYPLVNKVIRGCMTGSRSGFVASARPEIESLLGSEAGVEGLDPETIDEPQAVFVTIILGEVDDLATKFAKEQIAITARKFGGLIVGPTGANLSAVTIALEQKITANKYGFEIRLQAPTSEALIQLEQELHKIPGVREVITDHA